MTITRRRFLTQVAAGGMLAAGLPLVAACGSVTRNNIAPEENLGKLQQSLGDEKIEILRLASLAANSHNSQPWAVKVVTTDRWLINAEPARRLPAVDPKNRELLLSVGAFLENLTLAAKHFGYELEMSIVAKHAEEETLAELHFSKGRKTEFSLERLRKRRTVRSHFLPRELQRHDVKMISAASAGRSYYFPPDSPQAAYLAEGTLEANRLQVERDDAQQELADWIRWSNKDARRRRDGMTPASMDIDGIAGWYARNFFTRKDVMKQSFKDATLKKVREQVETNGGWIVLTAPYLAERTNVGAGNRVVASGRQHFDIETGLEGGRRFQQMQLKAQERSIALHPMTQMLEEADWTHRISEELGVDGGVQLVLRAGYLSSYPEPVSLRRPVSWFTELV